MAGSINRATIFGRVGRDPEVRSFQNGGKICTFSVATSESWKDRNTGEKKERTQWHNISVNADHLVRLCEQYVRKGKRIYLEGQIETRKWQDQSGQDRYSTEIVLRPYSGSIEIIDWPDDGDRGPSQGSGGYSGGSNSSGSSQQSQSNRDDFDDEIPF